MNRLPADFAFQVQELRPGSSLLVAATAYHDGRSATLNNVGDDYNMFALLHVIDTSKARAGSLSKQGARKCSLE